MSRYGESGDSEETEADHELKAAILAMVQEERPFAFRVRLGPSPLPFFAEYAYFLWGEVNYDSDGDCRQPTDRQWNTLRVVNRSTGSIVNVANEIPVNWDDTDDGDNATAATKARPSGEDEVFVVSGGDLLDVQRAALLTALRTGGRVSALTSWPAAPSEIPFTTEEFQAAQRPVGEMTRYLADADEVQAMFLNPGLAPFDSSGWWGGWKWCREIASEFTMGLRMTMRAVQTGHGDDEFMEWLWQFWNEPPNKWHYEGVRYALRVLTGNEPSNPRAA